MGFVIFFSIIVLLIINEVRKAIAMKAADNTAEDLEEDYFDDFENL